MQRKYGLDYTGNSGGGVEMTQVRFHRTDAQNLSIRRGAESFVSAVT